MGNEPSKYTPKQFKSPSPLLDVPWRDVKSVNGDLFSEENGKAIKDQMEDQFSQGRKFKPNILLMGGISAGKSSFINSVATICKGRIANVVRVGESESSLTFKFTKYAPKNGLMKNFRLFDCMGLERDGHGFHVDDAVNLVKGHIPKNYKFNPASPLSESDEKFVKNPKDKDKVHCVVFVIDAEALYGELPAEIKGRILELQSKLNVMEIPRVLVLTKIDKICPEVEKKIENVYKSVKVKKMVETASQVFKMPENHICPVKNYIKEENIDYKVNIPILLALAKMLNFAEDFIETEAESSDED